MRAILSKNNKFIQLSERPEGNLTGGLKVFIGDYYTTEYQLPIATCNVTVNKIRYSLKQLGYPKVVRVEIRKGNEWYVIM